MTGAVPPGINEGPIGEVTLLPPDISTDIRIQSLRRIQIPWHPSHDFVFSSLYDESLAPFKHDCRFILQQAVNLLAKHNLSVTAGYELEFNLLHPPDAHGVSKAFAQPGKALLFSSAREFDTAAHILDDMIGTMARMGITVCLTHGEMGGGQFELVLKEREVRRAVEDAVLAREVVRCVARRHGLQATFAPTCGGVGNGGHVHLSVDGHFGTEVVMADMTTADTNNLLDIGVDKIGQEFMAGVHTAMPWIMFAVNNSVTSYARVLPGMWSGAYHVWGVNNKEVPLRLVEDRTNFEVKVGDGISNPFLGMAAILTAGVVGVQQSLRLPEPCQVDPGTVAHERGYKLLPTSLSEAMHLFKVACQADVIASIFPREVVHDWTAVRAHEMTLAQEEGISTVQKLVMAVL